MWVKPLFCGTETTRTLGDFSMVGMSEAAMSMARSASPRSTRLARVAGSGTVWTMTRRKKGIMPSAPPFQASLRRRVTLSPGR